MKPIRHPVLSAALAVLVLASSIGAENRPMNKQAPYPPTRVSETRDQFFGSDVSDPYRWLEDAGNPDVQAWMRAQHEYSRAHLERLGGRGPLEARLRELLYVDSQSAPLHRGSRYFYTRRLADREKPILYWREGEDGPEKVLLDPNTLSDDGSVSLGVWAPSLKGERLAYALHRNNADEATLHVREVATGVDSAPDVLEGIKYGVPRWTPSGDGFYYIHLPKDLGIPVDQRPGYAEGRFHRLGTPQSADTLVRERTGDPRIFQSLSLSRDGRWLINARHHGWNATDLFFQDLSRAGSAWKPLVVGVPALFDLVVWKDRFYLLTNEAAPRYRIYRLDPERPDRSTWKEIVPERKDAVLDGMVVIGGHLVLSVLQNATSTLEIRNLDGRLIREVATPGLGQSTGVVGNPDEEDAYFTFTSFTQPAQVYRTSVRTGATSVWSQIKVPVDPSGLKVEQVRYPSRDGTLVSMFLVHRKDLKRDGSTPFLLGGYGGFNQSMMPSFAGTLVPWLEAGGGYALPNLRGGGEYGEDWHRAGMLHKKQNVFDDFIAAAEWLIKNRYTRSERLGISGGSNGGLLVGAALTQRPELFRAVICGVPLLDMVRYHLFGSGRTWIPEYGSAEDEAGFRTLFGYSPYHRVRPGTPYPAVLLQSADSDDRVDPMHARKMAALLQANTSSGLPILLHIEKNAGHGGAGLVKQTIAQAVDRYSFLMEQLGMKPAATIAP
jgi:prolyl oligopeptidase